MSFGKNNKGAIIREGRSQVLTTLDNAAGLLLGTKIALTEDFRMLKMICHAVITGLTAGEGEGLSLYLINGDLTLAEAEAAIEVNGPTNEHDRPVMEVAERFVKLIGAVGDAVGTVASFRDAFTDALAIVSKPRWTFGKSTSWQFLIYNFGSQLTTGSTLTIRNQAFGVWVD